MRVKTTRSERGLKADTADSMGGGSSTSKIDDEGETILEFSNPEAKQKPKNTGPAPSWEGRGAGYTVAAQKEHKEDISRPATPEPTGIDRDPDMAGLLAKYKQTPQTNKKTMLIRPEASFDPTNAANNKNADFGFAEPTTNCIFTPGSGGTVGGVDTKMMKKKFEEYDDDNFE